MDVRGELEKYIYIDAKQMEKHITIVHQKKLINIGNTTKKKIPPIAKKIRKIIFNVFIFIELYFFVLFLNSYMFFILKTNFTVIVNNNLVDYVQ
ncbi:MAG: hypothetical protein WC606_04475 [Candidatus Absconditabacterales bacterium]